MLFYSCADYDKDHFIAVKDSHIKRVGMLNGKFEFYS